MWRPECRVRSPEVLTQLDSVFETITVRTFTAVAHSLPLPALVSRLFFLDFFGIHASDRSVPILILREEVAMWSQRLAAIRSSLQVVIDQEENVTSRRTPNSSRRLPFWLLPFLLLNSHPAFAQDEDRLEAALRRSRPRVLQRAAEVDRLVQANWDRHGVKASLELSDQIFMRRVYLDVTGTIPTGQQALDFLDARVRNKRQLLIDRLLVSDGYVSHFYNYWADVLRIKSQLNSIEFHGYIRWVKDALQENVPYDRFVFELLTGAGRIPYNGAAGYILRDQGMPLDNMSHTAEIFLGTRIGCAQCHDHPFEEWTQRQFYEMAAFTYSINTTQGGQSLQRKRREVAAEIKRRGLDDAQRRTIQQLIRHNQWAVTEAPDRQLRLPQDYQYDDAKPNGLVTPTTIFAQELEPRESASPRQAFAAWVTSPENPRFAKVIANRLWKKLMGSGLIEPVDNIEGGPASNPELLEFLTEEMVRMRFNVKQFLRMLLYTNVYQRRAVYQEASEEPFHFPGPMLRRMTAEQIWDSLVTLSMDEPLANRYEQAQGYRFPQFDLQLASSREIVDLGVQAHEARAKSRLPKKKPSTKPTGPNLFRASEMRQPAPAGHFLRDFGASDRELIDGGNTDPTVTQILTLINGRHHYQIIREGSVLTQLLKQFEKNPQARIRVIYLSILGREPNKLDSRLALSVFQQAKQPRRGNNELIWILLNTPEFMFVQ